MPAHGATAPTDAGAAFPFVDRHRWSLRNNFMSGFTTPQLARTLWRYRRALSWRYAHRIAFLAALSLPNTLLAVLENWLYGPAIAAQAIHPEPIFVLGHPRTGTTLLQNILCQDPALAHVDTFQAGFPSAFLLLHRLRWALEWLIDDTRPMDAMPLSFATPAEDEIATHALSGGASPYACLPFMADFRDPLRYATFEEEGTEPEREAWTAAFLYFLKKVTLAAAGGRPTPSPRPLVIKSPVHVGRLPLLKSLFPRARFVFVHRHPWAVFRSNAVLAQEYFTYCYLGTPTRDQITDYILEQHALLYGVYLREREGLQAARGRAAEVAFAELEADPVGTLRRVYVELKIQGFEQRVAPVLEGYSRDIAGFTKNQHSELAPALRARLRRELAPVMEAFGYEGEG